MITQRQSIDIRLHLIKELNRSGFGDIVTEVNIRLEEEYEVENFERTSRYLLTFFLTECIEVLENLSNKDFPALVSRLNDFTAGDARIDTINVELLTDGKPEYYDLSNLPNYDKIISSFQEILDETRKEN
jgi:hypothetical protein